MVQMRFTTMACDYKYPYVFILCLFLSIYHQSYGDSNLPGGIEPSNKSLFVKLHAMEKSALSKKLEEAGLQEKERSVLAKALKGAELKAVEKSVLNKAVKELDKFSRTFKETSKDLIYKKSFGDESKLENVIEIKTTSPGPETTTHSLSNLTNLQLLDNESSFITYLLNKSLTQEKDLGQNQTDDSSSIGYLTTVHSLPTSLKNETQNITSTSNPKKEIIHSSTKSTAIPTRLKMVEASNHTNATESKPKDTANKYLKMDITFGDKMLRINVHDVDSWHYLPNVLVSVISQNSPNVTEEYNLIMLKDLNVYEGTVVNDSKTHVIGSIVNGLFYGYIFEPEGELLYVRKSSVMTSENFNSTERQNCSDGDALCHDLRLLETYDCVHKGKYGISCFLGKNIDGNGTSFRENSTKSYHPHFVPKHKTNVYCSVTLESDASHFAGLHNRSVPDAVREMLLAFLFANHVLERTDLNGDGEANKIRLRLAGIKLHDYDKGNKVVPMARQLKALSKEPQESCLTLKFVSEDLPKEEPLSVGFRGGMCMDNINQTEPAENVAVINLRRPEGPLSRFGVSWVTLRTIGQLMGSHKSSCKKPDPRTTLKDWRQFFSRCQGHNIAETLVLRGFCLKNSPILQHRFPEDGGEAAVTTIPMCGDGIVDVGEECDCGKVNECKQKRHCCVPPGRANQCQIDRSKGYECDLQHPCCSATCKVISRSMHVFCGGGDPECSSHQAYCDGKSHECPVVPETSKAFDGKTCGRGLLGLCSGGYCIYADCVKKGWKDCRCNASQDIDCMVCCEKEGQCLPALYLDLEKPMTVMFRKMGTQCGTEMDGKCNAYGECVQMKQVINAADKTRSYYITFSGMSVRLMDLFMFLICVYSMCYESSHVFNFF